MRRLEWLDAPPDVDRERLGLSRSISAIDDLSSEQVG